jgi:hypothetical protein
VLFATSGAGRTWPKLVGAPQLSSSGPQWATK